MAVNATERFQLIRAGAAQGAIVLTSDCPPFYAWVAQEIRAYLRRLTGAEVPLATETADGVRLVVGWPEVNPLAAKAEGEGIVSFSDLREEGFLVKSVLLDGMPHVFIGGNSERATMYAAYEFLEQCGIVFHLTGDIIPEVKSELAVGFDVRRVPEIKRRGLHMRHFVMPWMGLDEFKCLIDQMAKMKMNYLEFFWYVGGPWQEYAYNGKPLEIGDMYHAASGFTAWRIETYHFTHDDVVIGRERFTDRTPCAPEFQGCRDGADAFRVARQLLHEMIAYAHERKIEVWLGAGDCPGVPPNLIDPDTRPAHRFFECPVVPPGDPAGVGIWQAMLDGMAATYPEADGYWVWLAELYFHSEDTATREILKRYEHLRPLIPGKAEIMAMGYDTYVEGLDEMALYEGDLGLVHYGAALAEYFTAKYPRAKLGVSLLGRSYLFRALDAMLPPGVALQSMEACICWNRTSRVPMEQFDAVRHRETFLVPRLDDDTNEFAMQFNLGIYHHDRVLAGGREFGLTGIAPQTGRTRGLEQNARYTADGGWDTGLTPDAFYARYLTAIYGPAADPVRRAYALLEENEWALSSMGLDPKRAPGVFEGFGNFLNYFDSADVGWLDLFKQQSDPLQGPPWDITVPREQTIVDIWAYRMQAFTETVGRLEQALDYLRLAAPAVPAGSQEELRYVTQKTEAFRLFLRALCAHMECLLAYDDAFRAKTAGETAVMQEAFARCQNRHAQAVGLLEQTALAAARCADHPTDRHILFRFNVRVLLPLRAFGALIRNVVNHHAGRTGEETVEWGVILP
ncbi:MAG: alpha-glucuronidase family glycosyl hydrolase [Armatimonadota bacterium]